jgi:transcriptional regulator with XRE-family HTH domain
MDKIGFSEWLQKEIDIKGWSVIDLARFTRMDASYLYRIINNERQAGPELCRAIAHAFNIPQQDVFIRADLMNPPPKYDPETARIIHKIAELKPEYRTDVEDLIDAKLKRQKQPVDGGVKVRTGKTPVLNG